MSTLRNGFKLAVDDGSADNFIEGATAAGMGDLRRGWEAGRIGNEVNPLRTEELDAQIAGDAVKAQSLRGQIDALEQRQGMFAPRVGRVEDIHGVGNALDWAQGQIGQGAASMVDPLAVSAGLGTVGRIAGALPGPGKLIGKAASLGAMAIPVLMSKQQLTGEFIGEAGQDAELMARTSPQALRDMAGNYGMVAAIPDSVVPSMIGRQLSGLSRAGGAVARQSTTGPLAKTALGMGIEGGTEAGQNMGSQYAQGVLNPDRDTSGDLMSNVNAFAGGAIGSGPLTAAGAYAEAGHNRVGAGIDRVTEAAGGVVDMLNESKTVQGMKDAVAGAAGKAKDGVVDMMSDENGKASIDALVGNLKAGGQELKSQAQSMVDEHRILNDMPPDDIITDDAKVVAWMDQNAPARHQLVVDKLDAMPEDDAEAQQHLTAVTAEYENNGEQQAAIDAAAQFVLERSPAGRVQGRADALGDSLGRIAGVVAPAIGKGAVAAGKAVLGFGKAVLGGAQDGLRKKNEQTNEAPKDDSFMVWRDNYYGVTGQAAADKAIAEADPAVWSRAELAGSYASDVATRVNPKQPNLAALAKHAAFIMSDMVMRVGTKGLGAQNVRMNRLVDDLHGTFKTEAPEVLQQLGSIMGPKAAPVVEYMRKELTLRSAPGGQAQSMNARDVLARQAVGMVDPESQNRLMKQGVNLNTPRGREQLLNLMEDYADGIGSEPGMRKTLDSTFGKESVDSMMMLLNGQDAKEQVGSVVDDRNKTVGENLDPNIDDEEQLSDFDQREAEKTATKGAGPKVYGFSKAKNLRTHSDRRDMFGAMDAPGDDGVAQRPQLFTKGQGLFGVQHTAEDHLPVGERWGAAITKKIADIKKQLVEDPEYQGDETDVNNHDNYDVRAKSAHEIMKGASMQPGKVLQLYRDYLTMDGNVEDAAAASSLLNQLVRARKGTTVSSPEERAERSARAKAWSAANPNKTVEDYKAEQSAQRTAALAKPQAEMMRAAEAYFKERFVVVGEQLSNRDPSKITVTELMDMDREGAGMIERSRGEKDSTGAFKAYPLDVQQEKLNDANVLMFKDAKDPKKAFAIPAGKLVNWVKQARGKTEAADAEDTKGSFSGKAKDEAYLADVMEGIATLIGSGYVSGMPYKMNQFGKPESFNGGVPGSLRLATKTAGALQKGTETRREKRGRIDNEAFQGADQEAVAADQERNSEFFTPDDSAQRDVVVGDPAGPSTPKRVGSARAPTKGGKPSMSLARIRDVDKVGREPGEKFAASGADTKTTEDDRTPLDFSNKPKDGVPDEYANQRWLSVQTGASAAGSIGPEPKGTAASSAEFRAQAITDAFINEPAKGQEMIRTRIRSALAPEYNTNQPEKGKFTVPGVAGRDQLSGGVHYIAPVAYFASAENIIKNNLDLPAATIKAIQSKVANILLKGEVSPTEKVKIARLMFKGDDTKVTSMNVNAVLGRYAEGATQGKPMVAKSAPEVASAGLPKDQPTQSGTASLAESGGRKLNAMVAPVAATLADTRSIMRAMGFKSAPEKFADIASKLLTDPDQNLAGFVKDSAKALSYALTSGDNFSKVREALQTDAWLAERAKIAARLVQGGMMRGDALVESYRVITEMALVGELAARTDAEKSALGKLMQMVKELVSKFKDVVGSAEFTDLVRNMLNDAVVKAQSPQALKAGYKKVSFQEAVDADPTSAAVLAHMSKNPNIAITGSIVLANNGSIYRDASNMLHDLDLIVSGSKEAAESYLRSAFPDAVQVYDFKTSNGKVDTFIVPPKGATVENITRSGNVAGKGKITGFTVMKGGKEIGRTWNDASGEHKSGVTGTLVDFFTDVNERPVSTIPFTVGGQQHQINAMGAGSIFDAKLSMHRDKDINDYNGFVPNVGRKLNDQNAQDGNAKVASQADMDAAVAYALKTLGPKIKVDFKDITGYSGEFLDAKNVIEISTTAAAGTLNTLYHEAMHVFFRDFVKGNPKLQATFETLINNPKHLAKLNALLAGYPAAQAQLTSGEERLAYTYQFWKAGLLEVDVKSETWLQKIGKFFRHAMGMVRDSERALELFQAFDNGKMSEPSAAGLVIAEAMDRGTNVLKARRKMDAMMQGLAALTFPSAEILGNSISPTARRLGTMFFTNPGEESHGTKQPGLMNVRRSVGQQYVNTVNRKFETMSGADQAAVQKYLQAEAELADIPYAEHRAAVKDIRAVLDRFHKYMTDAGMKIGKIDKYYPTVWSAAALNDKKKEFVDMLVNKYAQQMNPDGGDARKAAERIWQSLVDKEGVDAHLPTDRDDGVLSPFFASQEMRTLPWLEGADKEMFLEKNMPLTLTRYFNQGAHATEYFRRFGKGGTKLDDMINGTKMWNPQTQSHDRMPNGIVHEIRAASRAMLKRGEFKDPKAQGKWVARQMRDITQATGAMEGSLGKDVSPNMRKFNSWMAVYQNIRLLPMALFSSFVDPLSMVARGAPWQAAYDTFVYSMREVFRGWADAFRDMPPEREKDEWRKLAEAIGASEIAVFSHHVSDEYSSTYMSAGAKKINDKMFVFNGMEAWNRGNRIMATKWAVRFIEQHAGLPDKHHSARWLKELGLTPDMVTKDAEGNLITNRHELAEVKGISLEQATKEVGPIHLALNRWVEGAVLTPNAAQRPSWSSDPNYASMFHLKQFSYSFHQTILKRATNEFKHGNMAPLGALAMFIPTMIGADIMKGLIQGAGTLPPYMAGMNAGDWLVHGAQRAGLAGIGSIGMDTGTDWASLGGPAFEQIVDAGRDGFGSKSVMNAMPVHSLYAHMVN